MSIYDRARDALSKATPGPWHNYAQQRHPTSDQYVQAEDGAAIVSSIMPEWASDGVAWNNGPLVALAPELAAAVDRAATLADELHTQGQRLGNSAYVHERAEGAGYAAAAAQLVAALEGDEK